MAATNPPIEIRSRTPSDLPALVEVLAEQQAATRYPYRWPLPFPVEDFLHAGDACAAWTAWRGTEVVGHACLITAPGFDPAVAQECAAALGGLHRRTVWLSSLFVASTERRSGLGRRLLATAVDGARSLGLSPCLEVLPVHAGALALYQASGWQEVTRIRPAWLPVHEPDVRVMVLPD